MIATTTTTTTTTSHNHNQSYCCETMIATRTATATTYSTTATIAATCHCHNYSHSELPVLLLAKKLLTMVVILPQPQPPLCGLLPPATPQQYDCYHHLSHSSYHYHWSLVLLSACMLPQEPHHLSFLLLPLPFLPLPALPSSKQCPLPALARSWRGLGGPWQGLPGDRGVPYPYMLEY